jgi:hypothetical protein
VTRVEKQKVKLKAAKAELVIRARMFRSAKRGLIRAAAHIKDLEAKIDLART